jgi:hypothetical protein
VPFIVVLSLSKGRVTAGDSASLNYLWFIDGATPFYYWQGGPDGSGQPVHATEQLLQQPLTYGFDSPFRVTYATWYAPDYWYEGATPHFDLNGQIHAILQCLALYAGLAQQLALALVGLACLLVLGLPRLRSPGLASAALLLPAAAALSMYALVLVEARYVAPFVVLLIVGLLTLVRLPSANWRLALSRGAAAAVLIALVVPLASGAVSHVHALASEAANGALLAPDEQAKVVESLRAAGLQPGDRVASGDRGLDDRWARLARVQLVAEVFDRDGAGILASDATARANVQRELLQTGARAVVAPHWPGLTGDPEWRPIPDTSYFYRLLPEGS